MTSLINLFVLYYLFQKAFYIHESLNNAIEYHVVYSSVADFILTAHPIHVETLH